jgi:hypothetical protein
MKTAMMMPRRSLLEKQYYWQENLVDAPAYPRNINSEAGSSSFSVTRTGRVFQVFLSHQNRKGKRLWGYECGLESDNTRVEE